MASVKKLQDYIRRSSGDVINTQNAANRTGMTPAIRKHIEKRNAGQMTAQRKLSEDMCKVCGQTPCNCTSIDEAKATMCGRCSTTHVHPSKGGTCPALKEAALPKGSMVPGISGEGKSRVKRAIAKAEVVPVEKAKATYGVGYREEYVVGSNPYIQEGLVDESSDKLYAGYQADVLSLKAKAAAQEKKNGPVDIKKLAARLKAVNLKSQGNK